MLRTSDLGMTFLSLLFALDGVLALAPALVLALAVALALARGVAGVAAVATVAAVDAVAAVADVEAAAAALALDVGNRPQTLNPKPWQLQFRTLSFQPA